jgi:hypothetical protein
MAFWLIENTLQSMAMIKMSFSMAKGTVTLDPGDATGPRRRRGQA